MSAEATGQLVVRTAEEILVLAGTELGPSPWLEVTQTRVDEFARTVDDWHWAHNEPERASRGPFGGPIVHAHLTLTLTVHLFGSILVFAEGSGMFYGYNRVRFPAPIPVGSRVRLHSRVLQGDDLGGGEQLSIDQRVEVEGQGRPGCVAEAVWHHYPIGAPG